MFGSLPGVSNPNNRSIIKTISALYFVTEFIENIQKNQQILNNQFIKINKDLLDKYNDLENKYNLLNDKFNNKL